MKLMLNPNAYYGDKKNVIRKGVNVKIISKDEKYLPYKNKVFMVTKTFHIEEIRRGQLYKMKRVKIGSLPFDFYESELEVW